MKQSNTKKLAVSGMMTALTVMLLLLSNIIAIGTYTFPAAAGILILILSYAAGKSYAWSGFTAVSLVSFLLCSDKETVLCFVLFFGYYPLLKDNAEKIPVKLLSYLVKLVIFNGAAAAVYLLAAYVFAIPQDFELFGVNMPLAFLITFNIIFLIYDYALTLLERNHRKRIQKFLSGLLK